MPVVSTSRVTGDSDTGTATRSACLACYSPPLRQRSPPAKWMTSFGSAVNAWDYGAIEERTHDDSMTKTMCVNSNEILTLFFFARALPLFDIQSIRATVDLLYCVPLLPHLLEPAFHRPSRKTIAAALGSISSCRSSWGHGPLTAMALPTITKEQLEDVSCCGGSYNRGGFKRWHSWGLDSVFLEFSCAARQLHTW